MYKYKKFLISFASITSVIVLLCCTFVFSAGAISNDNVTKSLLGLTLQDGNLNGVSTFVVQPYAGATPSLNFSSLYDFMPGASASTSGLVVGENFGCYFALCFGTGGVYFGGSGSLSSNYGSLYASDDYIHISLDFYSSSYFNNRNFVPEFIFTSKDYAYNGSGYSDLVYDVVPSKDLFSLTCTKISNDYFFVELDAYIDTSLMLSLNFDLMYFELHRNVAGSVSGNWYLLCDSLSVDNISASELPPVTGEDPSTVVPPDPDVNQPFDDLESELHGQVDSYVDGSLGGDTLEDSVNIGDSLFDDAVAAPGYAEFFEGDTSLDRTESFSFNPRDGMSFWSQIAAAFVEIPSINNLFKFALSVGIFGLLFNLIGTVARASRSKSSSSRTTYVYNFENKGGGK